MVKLNKFTCWVFTYYITFFGQVSLAAEEPVAPRPSCTESSSTTSSTSSSSSLSSPDSTLHKDSSSPLRGGGGQDVVDGLPQRTPTKSHTSPFDSPCHSPKPTTTIGRFQVICISVFCFLLLFLIIMYVYPLCYSFYFRLLQTQSLVSVGSRSVELLSRALSRVVHQLPRLLTAPAILAKFSLQTPVIEPPCQA